MGEIVNALEAKNHFGQLLESVQTHTVQINKHGRPVAYMLSVKEYDNLCKSSTLSLKESILKANKEEANDINYQKELSQWDLTMKDGIED